MTQLNDPANAVKESCGPRAGEEAGLARRWEGYTTGSEFWSTLSPPREPLNWRIWLNRDSQSFLEKHQVLCSPWKAKNRVCFSFLFPNLCFFVFFCIAPITLMFLFFFTPFPLICEFTSHLRVFPPIFFFSNPKFFLPLYLVSLSHLDFLWALPDTHIPRHANGF